MKTGKHHVWDSEKGTVDGQPVPQALHFTQHASEIDRSGRFIVVTPGRGANTPWVWDVEGNKYLDFLAAYSAANQGHCHPRIRKALVDQSEKVTLTSRAFRNDQLGLLYKQMTDLTGYPKLARKRNVTLFGKIIAIADFYDAW
jgi:acetylornithine/succinyldiaminopimelate/putrescine aminotransferase